MRQAGLTEVATKTNTHEQHLDHGHLLVVDDDPELRLLVSRFLQKHGYRVSIASRTPPNCPQGLEPASFTRKKHGVPEGIRTPDPRFRKPVLYPAELPGLTLRTN
jgi:hypothetical protein